MTIASIRTVLKPNAILPMVNTSSIKRRKGSLPLNCNKCPTCIVLIILTAVLILFCLGIICTVFIVVIFPNSYATPETEQKSNARISSKPAVPLRKECLNVVQKMTPMDLIHVDASKGNLEHPHLGGCNKSGGAHYIHNKTTSRQNPEPFQMDSNILVPQVCSNLYELLNKKLL